MKVRQIVVDTNVFVSALRSQLGASYKLLSLLDRGTFQLNLSVPLALEYEAVAKRMAAELKVSHSVIDDILNYVIARSNQWNIYYLWRPQLKDPADDMVLELAVTAGCQYIVTFNLADFRGSEAFGIEVLTPKEFLKIIGEA